MHIQWIDIVDGLIACSRPNDKDIHHVTSDVYIYYR